MALGANLQRYSMRLEAMRQQPRPRRKQPLLVAGVALFTGSGVLLSLPLIFAPQSLLSPIGVIIFVANAAFARCLNGERFSLRVDGLYLTGIVIGVVTCVLSAPKETSGYTIDELIALCGQPLFIGFMSALCTAIVALLTARRFLLKRMAHTRRPLAADEPRPVEETGGWAPLALAFCLGSLAGCLGGLNITATKSIFSLIQGTWQQSGFVAVILSPATWLIGLGLLATYITQISCTTDGLARCAATVFIPVQTVTEESIATLGGLLYFREFTQFTPRSAAFFVAGMCLSIACVARLTAVRIQRDGDGALYTPAVAADTPDKQPGTVDSDLETPKDRTDDSSPPSRTTIVPAGRHSPEDPRRSFLW